jgi:hypothetical protein
MSIQVRESFKVQIKEANITGQSREVQCVIIAEGLGNSENMNFYSAECIQKAAISFEGAKVFLDHPTETQENELPERSVNDLVGWWRGITAETDTETGQTLLKGNLHVCEGDTYNHAWELLKNAVEFKNGIPDKDFVAVSVYGGGSGVKMKCEEVLKQVKSLPVIEKLKKAIEAGKTECNYVTELIPVSGDIVTIPGAGGKMISIQESEKGGFKTMNEKLKEAFGFMKAGKTKEAMEAMESIMAEVEAGEAKKNEACEADEEKTHAEPDGDECTDKDKIEKLQESVKSLIADNKIMKESEAKRIMADAKETTIRECGLESMKEHVDVLLDTCRSVDEVKKVCESFKKATIGVRESGFMFEKTIVTREAAGASVFSGLKG